MAWNIKRMAFWMAFVLILLQTPVFGRTRKSPAGGADLGVTFGAIGPVGEFRREVGGLDFTHKFKENGAIGFNLILPDTGSSFFRLRFDYFFGFYETNITYVKDSGLRGFSLGPEIGVSKGPFRPYVNAQWGRLSYFGKAWMLGEEENKRIRNSLDGANNWILGCGFRLPYGPKGRYALDLGVRYNHGGTGSYMRGDDLQINPDGTYTFAPTRSQTHFLMFMLGIQFRAGGGK